MTEATVKTNMRGFERLLQSKPSQILLPSAMFNAPLVQAERVLQHQAATKIQAVERGKSTRKKVVSHSLCTLVLSALHPPSSLEILGLCAAGKRETYLESLTAGFLSLCGAKRRAPGNSGHALMPYSLAQMSTGEPAAAAAAERGEAGQETAGEGVTFEEFAGARENADMNYAQARALFDELDVNKDGALGSSIYGSIDRSLAVCVSFMHVYMVVCIYRYMLVCMHACIRTYMSFVHTFTDTCLTDAEELSHYKP